MEEAGGADGMGHAVFRRVVETSPISMVLVDGDGKVRLSNAHTEILFGYSQQELVGREIDILVPNRLRRQHVADRAQFMKHPSARPMGAGRDLLARHKDGREIPVEIALTPLPGSGSLVLASVIDLTRRKRDIVIIEESLAKLKNSYEELERFAYASSHDLQSPLRMVVNACELIQRRYKGRLDEDADRMIACAVDEARRMHDMLQSLLSYARVRAEQQAPARVDMQTAFAEAIASLEPVIKETGARVHGQALPVVWAVSVEFVLLFRHLIANAIKFRRGGVAPEVVVAAQRRQGEWLFSISDNGIGIEPEDQERIFEIFQRVRRGGYRGSGMGLPICKKIVERNGGRIWAESQPGKGSTFYFTLPTRDAERACCPQP